EAVTLSATSSTRILGVLSLQVTCAVPDAPGTALSIVAPVAAVVAGSPASPPAPIQAPSVSQGAAQSGVQSVASSNALVPQAGAAAAQQEQQQFQTAGIGKGEDNGVSEAAFQYSARRQPDQAPVTLAAGALLAIGAGLVRQRQGRRQHVHAFVRRR
ncbi:MAG: hypothetical protein ACI867_001499, partial [Glaciecola sp.]